MNKFVRSTNRDDWVLKDGLSRRQGNGCDCGVFLLSNALHIIKVRVVVDWPQLITVSIYNNFQSCT